MRTHARRVIESENDAVDSLVNESQEVSDEGVETDGNKRG
jgi:transcription termination/antitermination protein NusA